jgi:hypothetical protein
VTEWLREGEEWWGWTCWWLNSSLHKNVSHRPVMMPWADGCGVVRSDKRPVLQGWHHSPETRQKVQRAMGVSPDDSAENFVCGRSPHIRRLHGCRLNISNSGLYRGRVLFYH